MSMMIRILVLVLLTASLLPVFTFGCNSTKNAEEEKNLIPNVSIPLIDANVPTNIATATFALG